MTTWKLKSCPRCGGDLYLDKGTEGWEEKCLQCSYQRYLPPVIASKNQLVPLARRG